MNKKEYPEWINSKLYSFSNFLSDKKNPAVLLERAMKQTSQKTHTLCINNFIIYVNLYTAETAILNVKTMTSAKARCHPDDTFNVYEGVAVAWAKYNHESIPRCEKTVKRDNLVNGDKFISSVNKNKVLTFIGWIPNITNGRIGKWAVVLDGKDIPLKTQIAEEVVKMD